MDVTSFGLTNKKMIIGVLLNSMVARFFYDWNSTIINNILFWSTKNCFWCAEIKKYFCICEKRITSWSKKSITKKMHITLNYSNQWNYFLHWCYSEWLVLLPWHIVIIIHIINSNIIIVIFMARKQFITVINMVESIMVSIIIMIVTPIKNANIIRMIIT